FLQPSSDKPTSAPATPHFLYSLDPAPNAAAPNNSRCTSSSSAALFLHSIVSPPSPAHLLCQQACKPTESPRQRLSLLANRHSSLATSSRPSLSTPACRQKRQQVLHVLFGQHFLVVSRHQRLPRLLIRFQRTLLPQMQILPRIQHLHRERILIQHHALIPGPICRSHICRFILLRKILHRFRNTLRQPLARIPPRP